MTLGAHENVDGLVNQELLPAQCLHHCGCHTKLPVHLRLHFILSQKQTPKTLELPHLRQQLFPSLVVVFYFYFKV